MGGFASFMTGFSNTLAQSLTADTQARREGRLAEKTAALGHKYRTKEADIAYGRSQDDMFARFDHEKEIERMKQMNKKPDGVIPGFQSPFNIYKPEGLSVGSAEYAQHITNQIWEGYKRLPEKFRAAYVNGGGLESDLAVYGDIAFRPDITVNDDGDEISRSVFGINQYDDPDFQRVAKKVGGVKFNTESVIINENTNRHMMVLNSKTLDVKHKDYDRSKAVVDRAYGEGTWERWRKRFEASRIQGEMTIALPGSYDEIVDDSYSKPSEEFSRVFSNLPPVTKKFLQENEQGVLPYFKKGSLEAQVLAQYRKAGSTQERKKLATQLYRVQMVNAAGERDKPMGFYEDSVLNLSKALAYSMGISHVSYQGNRKVTTSLPGNRLRETKRDEIETSTRGYQQLFEVLNTLKEDLMTLNAQGEAAVGMPGDLSRGLTRIVGAGDLKGVIEQLGTAFEPIINAITGEKFYRGDNQETTGVSDSIMDNVNGAFAGMKDNINKNEQTITGFHNASNKESYWNSLKVKDQEGNLVDSDANKAIRKFYLQSKKVEVTYRLAQAWQGSSSRISDRDFKVIFDSIWTMSDAGGQAQIVDFIKIGSLKPYLREKVLLVNDKSGLDPVETLNMVDPAITAMYNYEFSLYNDSGNYSNANVEASRRSDQIRDMDKNQQPVELGPAGLDTRMKQFGPGSTPGPWDSLSDSKREENIAATSIRPPVSNTNFMPRPGE